MTRSQQFRRQMALATRTFYQTLYKSFQDQDFLHRLQLQTNLTGVLNLLNSLKRLLVGQLVGSYIMIILFYGSYDIFLPDANLAPNTLAVEIIRAVPCCRCCCSWSVIQTVNVSREITASVSTNLAECMNRLVEHHWTYLSIWFTVLKMILAP